MSVHQAKVEIFSVLEQLVLDQLDKGKVKNNLCDNLQVPDNLPITSRDCFCVWSNLIRVFRMNYLLQIGFDNSHRLSRKEYFFEYRGVRFKLVQRNPRKWSDALLTIVPEMNGAANELAFARAAEFLSALGWQNHSMVAFWQSDARRERGQTFISILYSKIVMI